MAVLLILGAVFVAAGLLVYSGRWRSWAAGYRLRPHTFFGLLWLGLALLFAAPAAELDQHGHHGLALVFEIPAAACAIVLILTLFRLPGWLLPSWYREWTARGSAPTEHLPHRGRRRV
jgi:hypothetical protein